MAHPCLLTVKGATQGQIKGPMKENGHEGKILVLAVEHRFGRYSTAEHHGAQGSASVHHNVWVTKPLDAASPLLAQAMATGERLEKVVLEHFVPTAEGIGTLFFTTTLTDAYVGAIHDWFPSSLIKKNQALDHMEDVFFVYRRISWRDEIGGVETEDQGMLA